MPLAQQETQSNTSRDKSGVFVAQTVRLRTRERDLTDCTTKKRAHPTEHLFGFLPLSHLPSFMNSLQFCREGSGLLSLEEEKVRAETEIRTDKKDIRI